MVLTSTYNPIVTLLGYFRGLEVGDNHTDNWAISTLNLQARSCYLVAQISPVAIL